MKKYINRLLMLMLLSAVSLSAQGMRVGGMGFMFPDTLAQVILSGKVTVDTTHVMPIYYLDINSDGINEYYLNFGPIWYTPDNSNAVRPKSGDQITIIGGQMNSSMNLNGLPMIIVYQVNGNLWRDPFDPMWNNFGNNTHMMGHRAGNCNNFAFGTSGTALQNVTLTGTALVDTTYFMTLYYLDDNNDGKPDYFLNFGPWWYESNTGAKRPNNGDAVTIIGGKLAVTNGPDVVVVYQINGKVWRDSTLIGNNFGGGWMRKNNSNDKVSNPFDENDFMMVGSGWNMGGMMTDSMFARMLELNPYNIPNGNGENIFKCYEIGIFNSNGSNGMMQSGCGGMMNFGANGNFQFHFDNKQIEAYHIDKNTMKVKYWNNQTNNWTTISNASINLSTNTITFSTNQFATYFILTSDNVTVVNENEPVPTGYTLEQNYPNPFNPGTNISYTLPVSGNIVLKIFDITGREVKVLDSGYKEAGRHTITLNAGSFASGVYFYQLSTGSFVATKKFILMK